MGRTPIAAVFLGLLLGFTPVGIQAEEAAAIGKLVRDIRLPNVVTGKEVRLADLRDRVVVVIFYSHTCTFCRNYESRFRQFAADQAGKPVTVLAVDSMGGKRDEVTTAWTEKKLGFPLLWDDRARTAATLGAMNLTTVCVLDSHGNLRYRGAFDDSESGKDIRSPFVAEAVTALLAGKPVPRPQTEVYGCLIPQPE